MNMIQWTKKNAPTILTILGGIGFVTTVGLTIRATAKSVEKIRTIESDRGLDLIEQMHKEDPQAPDIIECPKLSPKEAALACWTEYIPTAAVGIASLICFFGANALNQKQQAALASAYSALLSSYEGYRGQVRAICGEKTDETIMKAMEQEKKDKEDNRPPWDEYQVFYLDCYGKGKFFERTMQQIMDAEYNANRWFILKGQLTLNEFLKILDLEPVEDGDEVGWDNFIGETLYGYCWIDFCHRYYQTDDGLDVCAIDLPFEPHPLSEECE